MKEEYQGFITAHNTNRSLLRFHYHKLNTLEKRISELDIPLREYQSDMVQMPLVRQLVHDEINADLARGSGFAGGKRRIYEYWQEPHSTQDKADFLKHEFGTGGHCHACSNATHSGQDHDAKGVRYSKSGCDQVQMSSLQVARENEHSDKERALSYARGRSRTKGDGRSQGRYFRRIFRDKPVRFLYQNRSISSITFM